MESYAVVSSESLILPEPPDPDLDMVFPMDSPVPLVPLALLRAGSSVVSLPCSILSIIHVSPPPPSRSFKLGLKRYLGDPCHQPPQTYLLSQQVVNLVSDVGGNPLWCPSLNNRFVNLTSDVGGNPLRRSALSLLFVNLVSDVGGNLLQHPAMSHQKLVRSCCRRTTLTSSSTVEK
ncbi:hypothetical protein HID58_045986 [Brassica napus]|uniref:Uncharacterized protein n=1 Tax=Brassica napus TaxID=3708 RepID=A0ABQ8AVA6_BRANA|nr:hypothetical protein HID58_045986 [Brassica napus]